LRDVATRRLPEPDVDVQRAGLKYVAAVPADVKVEVRDLLEERGVDGRLLNPWNAGIACDRPLRAEEA
jgi:hypothetical protein